MQQISKMTILLILLSTFVLSGCSSTIAEKPKVYWPVPPNQPKMQWIATFASDDDFAKTPGQVSVDKLLGKQIPNIFKKPMGVVSAGDGVMYVADMDIGNIQVVDFNNKTMSLYSASPIGLPVGLALDSNGSLYVADTLGRQIMVFNRARQPVKVIGAGELGKPTFIALDEARGRLYVSDIVNNVVVVFDLDSGAKLFAFGGKGRAPGELFGPQGLAIDKEGKIFVAEQFNARVQVFDANGKHFSMFGQRGDHPFQFEGPFGLAFDSQGNLFVAEIRKALVQILMPDGSPLTALGGSRSFHTLGFAMPTSIYIDANDRIYISDSMTRRITIWQMLTPAYLAEHPVDVDALKKLAE